MNRLLAVPPLARTLCLSLVLSLSLTLAACGGGGEAPGSADTPAGTPESPGTAPPAPAAPSLIASADDAADTAYVQWLGASGTGPWTLERQRDGEATPTVLATVAEPAGRWIDGGLAASTAYQYRLRDAAGALVVQGSATTGDAVALRSDLGQSLGEVQTLALGPQAGDAKAGAVTLRYAVGSFSGTPAARVQAHAHTLADGVGEAWRLQLEQAPQRPLTVALSYGADENPDDVDNQTLAARTPDGRWWALPATAHERATRQLVVTLPEALLQPAATERRAAAGRQAISAAAAPVIEVDLVRFVALKLVPRQASVRVLGRVQFTPVATWEVKLNDCGPDGKELCLPMVGLVQRDYPVVNSKPGFERRWLLEGSTTPGAALGALAVNASTPGAAGVVYTAPATVPTTNPVTVRFESLDTRRGRRATASAKVRITEDRWVGPMTYSNSANGVGYYYETNTTWLLDTTQSSDSVRVYRAQGRVTVNIPVPACPLTASPDHVDIGPAAGLTELVVDEVTGRYHLRFNAIWSTVLSFCGHAPTPSSLGVEYDVTGSVTATGIRGDQQQGTVFRVWNLSRPE